MKLTRLLTIILLSCCLQSWAQEMNLSRWIQPVPATAKFSLDGFMVWCGSMVKGDDGKYYLFYSRWPKKSGHLAWVTESEVALAVSDQPTGPYKHVKVVLPKRDKKYWDADVTHNPTVYKFGKKYYLYYMGNYGNGEWWNHRNHQRIGVAIASSPLGPWRRKDKPLIDTTYMGFDHLITNNPAVTQRPDGKYLMIYKGVSDGKMPFGGIVQHGAALADNPEGPFKKFPNRIFVKDTVKFAAEDPFIWYQQGKYWAIVKDMNGVFTNAGTSLALFESKDGLDWKPSKNILVSTCQIPWATGTKKVTKLERPQLWLDKGIPRVLFCAVYDGDENYNVSIPLNPPLEKK
ncbi:MAG: sucrase [Bacteroidetes bacterium]|nr:sucrase [Bacteroidota bacterium]